MEELFAAQRWLYAGMAAEMRDLSAGLGPGRLATAMVLAALFGTVHAALPGHGKAVMASYFLGRDSRVLHGITAGALVALTHVGVAIVLVLGGFLVIEATLGAGSVGRAPAFEALSYALITAIGLWLFLRAIRPRAARPAIHHHQLALATGLIPCPLTTFIMVFAVAHGMAPLGIAVCLAMALGMVVTIASVAALAVYARNVLARVLHRLGPLAPRLGQGFEACTGLVIASMGARMLSATPL